METRMPRLLASSALLVCWLGVTDLVRSQDLRPGPPVPLEPLAIGEGLVSPDKGALLLHPAVQDELALTPAQKLRVNEVEKAIRRAEQEAFQRFQDRYRSLGPHPAPDDTKALSRRFQEELDTLGPKREAAMLKALEGGQRTRLDQVHLQVEGPIAFSHPGVRERLRLDPKQVRTIQSLITRGWQQVADGAGARSARRSTLEAITKLLSKDQHAEYLAMLGEPFDFGRLRGGAPPPRP